MDMQVNAYPGFSVPEELIPGELSATYDSIVIREENGKITIIE